MKRLCMALIRFYQRYLSPLKPYPTCRFTPTCSQYALEAFQKRGFFAGLVLSIWRILRCSPLSPGGYDPVPEKGFHTMPYRYSTYRKRCANGEYTFASPDFDADEETGEEPAPDAPCEEKDPAGDAPVPTPPSDDTPVDGDPGSPSTKD